MSMNKKDRLSAFVMITPVTLWLCFFIMIPLLYVFVLSFCSIDNNYNVIFELTFDNYKRLLDEDYIKIYVQSIIIASMTTIICISIAYPFTLIIARAKSKYKVLMYMLVIVPFWTNSLIRIYGWKSFLSSTGWLNNMLVSLNLVSEPVQFLYSRGTTIFGMVYCLFPFMVLPLYTVIEKLDQSVIEASADLGARKLQTLVRVIIPLTLSGIFSGSIMVFIPTLGYFFVSDVLGGGNADMIGNLIERQFQSGNNWPLGSALSIILIIVTLLLVKLYQKCGGKIENLGV